MRTPINVLVSLFVALLAVGCGGDDGAPPDAPPPLNYSAPVVINLSAKSADVAQNAISNEKGIMSEAGNPYGAFITAARQALFGRDPSRIDIASLSLVLGANTTGVTKLEDVFTGPVDVLFVMSGSNNTYPAGTVMNPTGTGPVVMTVSFVYASVAAQDHEHGGDSAHGARSDVYDFDWPTVLRQGGHQLDAKRHRPLVARNDREDPIDPGERVGVPSGLYVE